MLTLNVEKEVQLMMRERAFVLKRKSPHEEIELEARLGIKPGSSGTNGLFWINAYKYVRKIAERKTWANYTNVILEDVAVSYRRRDNNWTIKKEIRSVLLSDNWMKIALASESASHPSTIITKHKEVTRHIARHSFYIGEMRVDFSKTYTDGDLTYEVEIEYLAPAKAIMSREENERYLASGTTLTRKEYLAKLTQDSIQSFIELIYSVTSAMFLTPLHFTYEMLLTVSAVTNAVLSRSYENRTVSPVPYVDRRHMSEAIALDISMLNYSWLFRKGRTWSACLKTDGERRLLVIADGTYLLFPPLQAALFAKNEAHNNTRITIVDGEYYRDEFWVIDALWIDGEDVRKDYHLSRYDRFKKWEAKAPRELFGPLPIRYKNHEFIVGSDFFVKVGAVWESRKSAGYPVDGIIFTPDNSRYEEGTDEDNRIILKWKPSITVDLVVSKNARGKIIVLAVSPDRSEEQFRGSDTNKLEDVDMQQVPYNRGAIVEFECKGNTLLAVRERPEKLGPNKIGDVISSWRKSTIDTMIVSEDTLLGRNNVLMRKYHNRVKMSLIENASRSGEDLVLLDIGSGRGGDLSKWDKHHFGKIICVEPNGDNIKELRDRLSRMTAEFQSRVYICQARGEDTNIIKTFAKKNGIDKVDVVSMMDSLTYFFDPERKNLAALARTVDSLLIQGGLFIWKSLDGASVRLAFSSMDTNLLTYGDSTIALIDNNTVKVDIPPNQMGIVETLTDVRALKQFLDLTGEPESSQGEGLLTSPYIALSRLYTFGSFIKGKRLELTREMREVFKIPALTAIKKVALGEQYKSVIEAIESTFSSLKHSILIYEYAEIAIEVDHEYAAVGTEPIYSKFETAHLGYFSSLFLERSVTNQQLLETDIVRDADLSDVHTSLALASLLKLDVFIVNDKLELQLTNAIVGHTSNPCCIVLAEYGGFRLRPFSNGLPLALSSDSLISKYERNPAPDFHEILREEFFALGDDSKEIITSNKKLKTNVLNRLAYVEDLPAEVRYLSLANALLNSASETCGISDLDARGIGGDYPVLIAYVNGLMKKLLRSNL